VPALRDALAALLRSLPLVVLLAVMSGCAGPPTEAAPMAATVASSAPPDCHRVAVAWCDAQAGCGPIADECHTDWHLLCASLQDAGAPEVSRACVAELEQQCAIDGLPLACVRP